MFNTPQKAKHSALKIKFSDFNQNENELSY